MYHITNYYYRFDSSPEALYLDDTVDTEDVDFAISEWCEYTCSPNCECSITADTQEEVEQLLNYVIENIDRFTGIVRCKYPWVYIKTGVERTLNCFKSGISQYTPGSPISVFYAG